MGLSGPQALSMLHPRLRLLLNLPQPRILWQDQLMQRFNHIRRLNGFASIVIEPPSRVNMYHPNPMVAPHMVNAVMPRQQYAANGPRFLGRSIAALSTAGSSSHHGQGLSHAHVTPQHASNYNLIGSISHQGQGLSHAHMAPQHASNYNLIGYGQENLKRKAVSTELMLGPSDPASYAALRNWFDLINNTRKEEDLQTRRDKKKPNFLQLKDEDDEVKELTALEFFPGSAPRAKRCRLAAGEGSSSAAAGSRQELDLTLKL